MLVVLLEEVLLSETTTGKRTALFDEVKQGGLKINGKRGTNWSQVKNAPCTVCGGPDRPYTSRECSGSEEPVPQREFNFGTDHSTSAYHVKENPIERFKVIAKLVRL